MILAAVVVALVLALAFLPGLWVKSVMRRHAVERADFPGSGGELARHLLDGMGLDAVRLEATAMGDHYDPEARAVRLTDANMHGRSLTAVVVAAHEVGHAMQHATDYRPLTARTGLAKAAHRFEQVAIVAMIAAPVLVAVTKSPAVMVLNFGAGALMVLASVIVHLVTLPVEYDASFRRALPVLEKGGYLKADDMPAARSILRAAAFTYVAAAAMSLLNVARWIRVLR